MFPVGEHPDGRQAPPKLQERVDVGVEAMEGKAAETTHALEDGGRTPAAADVN